VHAYVFVLGYVGFLVWVLALKTVSRRALVRAGAAGSRAARALRFEALASKI
jgi:hypothetical protein